MEMLRWWEKRRIVYNLILFPGTALILWSMWDYVGNTMSIDQVILQTILGLFTCNLFYTIAWIGGVLRIKYLGGYSLSSQSRWILFSLGTIFTLIAIYLYFTYALDVLFADGSKP